MFQKKRIMPYNSILNDETFILICFVDVCTKRVKYLPLFFWDERKIAATTEVKEAETATGCVGAGAVSWELGGWVLAACMVLYNV